MEVAFKKETIMNSFRACGLFPFNPDAVDYSKCLSKASTEREGEPINFNILKLLRLNGLFFEMNGLNLKSTYL